MVLWCLMFVIVLVLSVCIGGVGVGGVYGGFVMRGTSAIENKRTLDSVSTLTRSCLFS